jgi:hypothetical protein
MSRFLLRNTVRDPRFASLRKKHESAVVLRPFIGGKPLPPAATRVLVLSDLSVDVVAEIEAFVATGNVEFLAVGRQGPAVDFKALRQQLGQTSAPVATAVETTVAAEVVTEVAATPVPVEPEPAPPAEEAPISAPEPAPEAVIEEPAATEATSTEAAAAEKVWTREELEAAKLVDLRDILIALGGKPAGKNKAVVVDEILAAQGGV